MFEDFKHETGDMRTACFFFYVLQIRQQYQPESDMPVRRYRSRSRSRSRRPRNLKVGTVLKFYNVGARKSEKSPIDGFFSRSNKKGRTIEFAYSTGKYNDPLTQIISNKPSGRSRSRRRSRTRSRR